MVPPTTKTLIFLEEAKLSRSSNLDWIELFINMFQKGKFETIVLEKPFVTGKINKKKWVV